MPLNINDLQTKCDTVIRLVECDLITLDEARHELGFAPLTDDLGKFTLSMYLNLIENMQQEEEFLDVDPNLN